MNTNKNLQISKNKGDDEFYTLYEDIENELSNYKEQFKNCIIYCNCDDYRVSNFVKYFKDNFNELKIKKLIATHYATKNLIRKEISHHYEYDGKNEVVKELRGNGSFNSKECINLLKEADIIVTNPPFSKWIDYIKVLVNFNKKFLVISNFNACTYRHSFSLMKENKIRVGYNWVKQFETPEGKSKKFGNVCWVTNLEVKEKQKLVLTKKYDPEIHKKFDNYDCINVDKVSDIPYDYDGIMAVPITFLDKYNPEQFIIIGDSRYHSGQEFPDDINFIDGKETYRRILVKLLGNSDIKDDYKIFGNNYKGSIKIGDRFLYKRLFIQQEKLKKNK